MNHIVSFHEKSSLKCTKIYAAEVKNLHFQTTCNLTKGGGILKIYTRLTCHIQGFSSEHRPLPNLKMSKNKNGVNHSQFFSSIFW